MQTLNPAAMGRLAIMMVLALRGSVVLEEVCVARKAESAVGEGSVIGEGARVIAALDLFGRDGREQKCGQ